MHGNGKSLAILLMIVLIGALMWFLGSQSNTSQKTESEESENTPQTVLPLDLGSDLTSSLFVCDNNKRIGANFKTKGVKINLSDERTFELPQTVSGSGARYANRSESIVFWNKGNTAFLEENGVQTYKNCTEVQAELD